jgi:CO/xanthine dehydrogenase FAD-binding subunit
MIPKHKFIKVGSLEEVLELLNENDNAKVIAGGTDIIPGFHIDSARFRDIKFLIDINNVEEFNSIELTGNKTTIYWSCNKFYRNY